MQSATIPDLLGQKLVKPDNSELEVAAWFDGTIKDKAKYIGLYYGAHWAPPSRLYTTNLEKNFYSVVKADDELKDLIEVVFVSDDREIGHFQRNIAKMPWPAVPFD